MTDLNFINAYNEVILENFDAVLKQNFLFQTRIRFLEEQAKRVAQLEENLVELESIKSSATNLQAEIDQLKNEVTNRDAIIRNNNQADADSHRLQVALNNQAQDIQRLNNDIDRLKQEVNQSQEYISQLEEMLPNSKRKKLGLEIIQVATPVVKKEEPKEDTPISDVVLKNTANGGTF